ncbi:MAG: hypothetical protein A2010_10530 [Nitrospirae bacterium GWD2_57_9]|nr:MAG: hypothetical protein A2010_10530 [Nitrospirae bacterium GWD2_57_9]
MKKIQRASVGLLMTAVFAVLVSCGGDGGGAGETWSCPPWRLNDSMTYARTETVSGVPIVSTMTRTVTARAPESVTLSDGATTKSYAVTAGIVVPLSEEAVPDPDSGFYGSSSTYGSTTAFCPPPAAGERYEYATWINGPWEGTGEEINTTLSVTAVSTEAVSTPAGGFTARKIVMDRVSLTGSGLPWLISTVTRYYVSGIGVVKEVEEIPATETTITDELAAYSFQQ